MQQISTPELLVKHLYNETDKEESTILQNALEQDSETAQTFKQMQEVKNALDEAGDETPGENVIRNILEFSKQQELTASH